MQMKYLTELAFYNNVYRSGIFENKCPRESRFFSDIRWAINQLGFEHHLEAMKKAPEDIYAIAQVQLLNSLLVHENSLMEMENQEEFIAVFHIHLIYRLLKNNGYSVDNFEDLPYCHNFQDEGDFDRFFVNEPYIFNKMGEINTENVASMKNNVEQVKDYSNIEMSFGSLKPLANGLSEMDLISICSRKAEKELQDNEDVYFGLDEGKTLEVVEEPVLISSKETLIVKNKALLDKITSTGISFKERRTITLKRKKDVYSR